MTVASLQVDGNLLEVGNLDLQVLKAFVRLDNDESAEHIWRNLEMVRENQEWFSKAIALWQPRLHELAGKVGKTIREFGETSERAIQVQRALTEEGATAQWTLQNFRTFGTKVEATVQENLGV